MTREGVDSISILVAMRGGVGPGRGWWWWWEILERRKDPFSGALSGIPWLLICIRFSLKTANFREMQWSRPNIYCGSWQIHSFWTTNYFRSWSSKTRFTDNFTFIVAIWSFSVPGDFNISIKENSSKIWNTQSTSRSCYESESMKSIP